MTTDTDTLARQILKDAAEIVLQGHCKKSYAALENGTPTDISDPAACRFCVAGAIVFAGRMSLDTASRRRAAEAEAFNRLRCALVDLGLGDAITAYNDHPSTTPAHVAGALVYAALDGEA